MTNMYHLFLNKPLLFLSKLWCIFDEWYSIASNEWKWSLRYFQSSIMQKVLKKWIIIITKVSDFLCILLRNTKDNVFVIHAWYCHYNVLLVITHLYKTMAGKTVLAYERLTSFIEICNVISLMHKILDT